MEKRNVVLVADDSIVSREMLNGLLRDEYEVVLVEDGQQALDKAVEYGPRLAIILLDLLMPGISGLTVLQRLKEMGVLEETPAIIITAEGRDHFVADAYDLGVCDIIRKPYDARQVRARVRNVVQLYRQKAQIRAMLAKRDMALLRQAASMKQQAARLSRINAAVIDALSNIIEYRDMESGQHIRRIRAYTRVLMERVVERYPQYQRTPWDIEMIVSAAAMHDVGKIAIPDAVLMKPGPLTPEEFEIMKTHTTKGRQLLQSLEVIENLRYMTYCYNIALYHHEKWDGRGYPMGLKGDEIPICAQVVSLADCYDALTHARVYKPPYSHEVAAQMIQRGECGCFSPKLLDCFCECLPVFEQLGALDEPEKELPSPLELDPESAVADSVNEFVRIFFLTYLEKRDVGGVLRWVDESATWMGSGAGELCSGRQQILQTLTDWKNLYPQPFRVNNFWQDAEQLGHGLWLVRGELDICEQADVVAGAQLRYSILCRPEGSSFKVLHWHVTIPGEARSTEELLKKHF